MLDKLDKDVLDIVVCIKQVPDTTEIKIDPITNTLKRDGVESIINPDDKGALACAINLKQRLNARVTALCMGPMQASKALAEALSLGADRAILLSSRVFAGSDTLATSKILSSAIKKLNPDLVLAGRQAIDGDTAQVGPQIAEIMGIPQLTHAIDVDYQNQTFTVTQNLNNVQRVCTCPPPLLVTIMGKYIKDMYMDARLIASLDQMEIQIWNENDLDLDLTEIGLNGSPTRVKQTFNKELSTQKDIYQDQDETLCNIIIEKLAQLKLV